MSYYSPVRRVHRHSADRLTLILITEVQMAFPVNFQWCVLHCGHCYCLDCIRVLCEQFSFGGRNRLVKCAVCRDKTYHSDISYVSTTKTDDETEGEMRVQVREIKVQVILI